MQNKLETTTLTQYTVYTKATAYKGLHIPDLLYITSYVYQGQCIYEGSHTRITRLKDAI